MEAGEEITWKKHSGAVHTPQDLPFFSEVLLVDLRLLVHLWLRKRDQREHSRSNRYNLQHLRSGQQMGTPSQGRPTVCAACVCACPTGTKMPQMHGLSVQHFTSELISST
eukprot:scaffold285350_cov18-Tisochrysis_lutea.AAC.1